MFNKLTELFVKAVYAEDVVGTIDVPSGIPSDIGQTGNFITAIIRFVIILGGLFTLWQFLNGGLTYITSNGDKAKISEASNKITMSLTGLVIMAASFIIIAIVSKLLFNDFTAILIPKFTSVTP
ncbi:MAG TPA: hypothetical protein VLH94_03015 [Spirochaetia bacterium]|nr:hypothetical protein [Spirochaetia bacterium]